jgi:hypothetical protein
MVAWLLRRTRILRLQPGDVIVYRAVGRPSPQIVEIVAAQLKALFGDHEVVVVAGGDLEIVRPDDQSRGVVVMPDGPAPTSITEHVGGLPAPARGAGWTKPCAPPPEGSRPTGLPARPA